MELYNRLCTITKQENVMKDEPMKKHTTFRIGGPADVFVMPRTIEEVSKALEICRQETAAIFHTWKRKQSSGQRPGVQRRDYPAGSQYGGDHSRWYRDPCSSGALLSSIAVAARRASLAGFEFAGGIPGYTWRSCCDECGCIRRRNEGCTQRSHCDDRKRRNSCDPGIRA